MTCTEYSLLIISQAILLASIQIFQLKVVILKIEKKLGKIQREFSMNNTLLYIIKENRIELNFCM